MCVSRKVLYHFSGCLNKKISIVPPLLPWFSSCSSPHIRVGDCMHLQSQKATPLWAVFSKWGEWLALLGAYN